jgi:3-methyladenine DNA glycosylase AlkC
MAEALKNHYGREVPRRIAAMVRSVHPRFNARGFLRTALDGYDALELMQRGRQIAGALRIHLPDDYAQAIKILLASLHAPSGMSGNNPMASFLYLPHTLFVAQYGLGHFDVSMRAQHALTQRFTAEFSIRPFLEQHTQATLKVLRAWTNDPSEHVRRLVSEGTRPRLPWATRLRMFQRDPQPVLALLELLKDDPSLYVRRSVANNLNDIGKDHPDLLLATAARWSKNAGEHRRWIVGHALRSAVKRGEQGALRALGFGNAAKAAVRNAKILPARVSSGGTVSLSFDIVSKAPRNQPLLVDLRVHYMKANGRRSPKVFKLRTVDLAAGAAESFRKQLSLRDLTTRKHHPGIHEAEVLINGCAVRLGRFELLAR